METQFLNIEWLKKNYSIIHYFGLGFIQIKLNERERLHFYTNKIEKTVKEEDIHNHRYNFTSQILKGQLLQQIYEIDLDSENKDFYLTQETCKIDNKKEFPNIECNINEVVKLFYTPSQCYYIDHNTFHKVSSDNAITLVTRSKYKKEYADVVYRKGIDNICPFSIKKSSDELFQIIEEILNGYGISH